MGRPAGRRVPQPLRQGRRHRPRLLPQARPQRGRRPVDDPAGDVRRHRRQGRRPRRLHRGPHRPRRPLRGRGRGRPPRLPRPDGGRVQRGPLRRGRHPGRADRHHRFAAAAPRPGHQHRQGRAAGHRQRARRRAGGLRGAPARRAGREEARPGVEGRRHRLGFRRAAGLRFARRCRPHRPPGGRGRPPRHVHPAPRGAHRPEDGRGVQPDRRVRRGAGQRRPLHGLQLGTD